MKNEKGFTLIELSISIVAFVLFAIIVANLNYAIFSNSIHAKQNALLTEKAVKILELVGTMDIKTDFDSSGNLIENSSLKVAIVESNNYTTPQKNQNILSFGEKENSNIHYIVSFEDYASNTEHSNAEKNIIKTVTVSITQNTEKVEIKRILTLK